ncbi:MAG TPA: competence/damage-inducible protein A [Clostridia bacterium]|nr:competence/damage-inducible protein A [Clostridia bacterium]
MKAEIISVGTELLLGQIVNTNAAFLGQRLAALGVDVYFTTTVGDNFDRIVDAVRQAAGRADIIVTSGGLGPTTDDLTKEAVCAAFNIPIVNDERVREKLNDYLGRRGFGNPEAVEGNAKQALVPKGSIVLENPCGTAPGLIIEMKTTGGPLVVMLPGPPRELEPLWYGGAEPYISGFLKSRHQEGAIYSRVLRAAGIGEPALEKRIEDLVKSSNPTVAPCAKGGEIHLRITAKAKSHEQALEMVQNMDDAVSSRLGQFIFGRDQETLEGVLGRVLEENGLCLAAAESCTAGMFCARIVNVPGSSKYFAGGVVSYSDDSKRDILGVPEPILREHGAVSAECAVAMAHGACERFKADIGVSITGIAGPDGGTPEKPVGTVFIGIFEKRGNSRSAAYRRWLPGSRSDIRERAAEEALILLRRWLLER